MSFDLNRRIRGRVWKFGDSIDTDAINPYYRYPTMEELKQHTMEAYRPEFPKEVKPGDIIVAGRNFGCGSRRPGIVLREVGIAAIVAESVVAAVPAQQHRAAHADLRRARHHRPG